MIEFRANPRNATVFIRLLQTGKLTRRAIRQSWFEVGRDLKASANTEILRKPKGGRTYYIRGPSGRRRRHVASAPGETHANLSGRLRRSIGWQVHGWRSMEFGYGVDKPAPVYGKFVENGTGKIKPRPSLGNAVRDIDRNATAYFNRNFKNVIK